MVDNVNDRVKEVFLKHSEYRKEYRFEVMMELSSAILGDKFDSAMSVENAMFSKVLFEHFLDKGAKLPQMVKNYNYIYSENNDTQGFDPKKAIEELEIKVTKLKGMGTATTKRVQVQEKENLNNKEVELKKLKYKLLTDDKNLKTNQDFVEKLNDLLPGLIKQYDDLSSKYKSFTSQLNLFKQKLSELADGNAKDAGKVLIDKLEKAPESLLDTETSIKDFAVEAKKAFNKARTSELKDHRGFKKILLALANAFDALVKVFGFESNLSKSSFFVNNTMRRVAKLEESLSNFTNVEPEVKA